MTRGFGRQSPPPSIVDIQALCQRVRLAGAPGGPARSTLVAEYERIARALGLAPTPVTTGADLQQAAVAVLRQASAARRALESAKTAERTEVRRKASSW